jgi:hypothetical protein
VIVRILGTGQYRLDESDMAAVERADDAVEAATAADDQEAFPATLRGLIETIDEVGAPVADDDFVTSDVIVPDVDTTLQDIASLGIDADEGLIPG